MGISILVVDDDEAHLDCVSKQVALLGYVPYYSRSGAQALRVLESHQVDLVITACQVGNMNGVQLRDFVLRYPRRIPIILMAVGSDLSLRTGFDGFLQKPFTLSELYREVERVRPFVGGQVG